MSFTLNDFSPIYKNDECCCLFCSELIKRGNISHHQKSFCKKRYYSSKDPVSFNNLMVVVCSDDSLLNHCQFFVNLTKSIDPVTLVVFYKVDVGSVDCLIERFRLFQWTTIITSLNVVLFTSNEKIGKSILNAFNYLECNGNKNNMFVVCDFIITEQFPSWKNFQQVNLSEFAHKIKFLIQTVSNVKDWNQKELLFGSSINKIEPSNDLPIKLTTNFRKRNIIGKKAFCYFCHFPFSVASIKKHEKLCQFSTRELNESESIVYVVTVGNDFESGNACWYFLSILCPQSFLTRIIAKDLNDFVNIFQQSFLSGLHYFKQSNKGKIKIYIFGELFSLNLFTVYFNQFENIHYIYYYAIVPEAPYRLPDIPDFLQNFSLFVGTGTTILFNFLNLFSNFQNETQT